MPSPVMYSMSPIGVVLTFLLKSYFINPFSFAQTSVPKHGSPLQGLKKYVL